MKGGVKMKKAFLLILLIICLTPPDSFGDDCIEGDCVNGQGTMVYATGHKFTGGFKDGGRHGDGVLLMPGDRKIVGTWQNNEIVEGTFTQRDGTQYVGQWKFRERNGQGTLTFADGRKYTGAFKSGQRHGQGTMLYPDGRKYVGNFNYGERSGSGTMTYPDGRKYTGEFKAGERNGQGTMIYSDGKKQEGEFRNGEFVGK